MNRVRTEDEEHDDTGETGTGRDMALGAAFAGARAGAAATRVVLAPVRLAARAPIVSSVLQRAGARLSSESQAARRQIETTATELLEAPELERTVDRVLAGPLPDSVAHSIGEHRVAERVAAGVLTTADLEAAVAAALDNERTQRIVEQVVDSAGLERIVVQVLESHLTVEVTERVLRSPEIQKLIERVAASPEIRAALTHQTSSLAGEVVGGVRHRLERLDDAAERTIHRWLHRSPAASTGTDAYGGLLIRAVAFGIDIAIAGLITFVTIALLSLVGSLVGEDCVRAGGRGIHRRQLDAGGRSLPRVLLDGSRADARDAAHAPARDGRPRQSPESRPISAPPVRAPAGHRADVRRLPSGPGKPARKGLRSHCQHHRRDDRGTGNLPDGLDRHRARPRRAGGNGVADDAHVLRAGTRASATGRCARACGSTWGRSASRL